MYCWVLQIYNIFLFWLIFLLKIIASHGPSRDCMAGLRNSCDGFAYSIDAKDGGYVLNITNAVAVFAAVFAMIFGGERLTLQATLGGVMVLTAMFMIVLKEN
jgi:hypothetical protein